MAGNPVKELSVSVLVGAGGGRPQPCKPFRNASQAYLRQALQRFGPIDYWRCKSTKKGSFWMFHCGLKASRSCNRTERNHDNIKDVVQD